MTPERKRLAILLGALVVIAALSFWPSSSGTGAGPASGRRPAPGRREVAAHAPLFTVDTLPTPAPLAPEGDRPESVRRNVFAFPTATPPPTPKPPTPTRTPFPAQGQRGFYGPVPTPPPPPPPTATPIVPPPIPYTAVGFFGPPERPIVALEAGGRLINAREGDVLDGRFIVVKINRESVDFAFKDIPLNITRRLPISR